MSATDIEFPKKPPIVAPEGTANSDLLSIMQGGGVNHVPLIDSTGVPVALVHLRDLNSQILLSTPHMGDSEMEFVTQAFESNWIAPLGPNVDAFEQEIAERVGIGHAAAVSSGTAAIHLSLVLLGVTAADTVFCSTLTFVASANPILYQGARPVFIDSEPDSWNMSPPALERALLDAEAAGSLPRAVIVVNLYGQSADYGPIVSLCDRFDVPIIEDAAESLGATYRERASGTLGKIGVYSFNGNKIITTSGGGMIVSDDQELMERARFLATQARESAPYYLHTTVGYNYRMSNVLAGIGRGQLRVLDERVAARRLVFDRYVQGLANIDAIKWMPEASYGYSNRWLSCCFLCPDSSPMAVTELLHTLAEKHIEARHLWRPMHQQPLFDGCTYYSHDGEESISDLLFQQGLCLPSGSNMSEEQQDHIIAVICNAFGR
ncbi:MAG: DegT/DnrJ/EryC1/StrS family aminotransferase [bacterium]